MRRTIAIALVLGGFVLTTQCGGGPRYSPPPPAAHPGAPPRTATPARTDETDDDRYDNPRWRVLASSFERFAERPARLHKDIFRSQLGKFFDVPEIELHADDEDGEEVIVAVERVEPYNPLKQHPATSYTPVVIMTGTALPQVLLRTPQGETHTATIDTPVGQENGVITSITQFEVIIRHDGPEPVRLNLRPDVLDIGEAPRGRRARPGR